MEIKVRTLDEVLLEKAGKRGMKWKHKKTGLGNLVGNVYRNAVTGTQWKLVAVGGEDGRKLTFEDKNGNQFDTIPEGTGNYKYVGADFEKAGEYGDEPVKADQHKQTWQVGGQHPHIAHRQTQIKHGEGMGGFLTPPGHPEHTTSVELDLHRRPRDRGGMSLSSAAEGKNFLPGEWIDPETRAEAKNILEDWHKTKKPLTDPEVQDWVHQVMGYFKGMYAAPDEKGEDKWNVSRLLYQPELTPVVDQDRHAGVNFIKKYYPEFKLEDSHVKNAYWGKKTVEKSDLEKAGRRGMKWGSRKLAEHIERDPAYGHQLKIARDTLNMNPAMVPVMGGMTIAEAQKFIAEAQEFVRKHNERFGKAMEDETYDDDELAKSKGPWKRGKKSQRNIDIQKKKFGWTEKDGSDQQFIEWWSRNHGSGYIDRAREFLMEAAKSISDEEVAKSKGPWKRGKKSEKFHSPLYEKMGEQPERPTHADAVAGFDEQGRSYKYHPFYTEKRSDMEKSVIF